MDDLGNLLGLKDHESTRYVRPYYSGAWPSPSAQAAFEQIRLSLTAPTFGPLETPGTLKWTISELLITGKHLRVITKDLLARRPEKSHFVPDREFLDTWVDHKPCKIRSFLPVSFRHVQRVI